MVDEIHQIWGEQSSIIVASNGYFGSDALLRFEMRATQRRMVSKLRKLDAKFHTF